MTRIDFIKEYNDLVQELSRISGIYPELIFAQSFIESADGSGKFANNYNALHGNNYFGIKASKSWKGATIKNPQVKSESNIFRAYDTPADSIRDYFKFLTSNKRYKEAGVFSAANWKEQAKALANAGYAGKGHEQHYYDLISKVGGTVNEIYKKLGKVIEQVSKHKEEAGLIFAALAALAGFIYMNRK